VRLGLSACGRGAVLLNFSSTPDQQPGKLIEIQANVHGAPFWLSVGVRAGSIFLAGLFLNIQHSPTEDASSGLGSPASGLEIELNQAGSALLPPAPFAAFHAMRGTLAIAQQAVEDLLRAAANELAYRAPERLVGERLTGDLFGNPFHGYAHGAHQCLGHALLHDSFEQGVSCHARNVALSCQLTKQLIILSI
jgi:hypothetical protein